MSWIPLFDWSDKQFPAPPRRRLIAQVFFKRDPATNETTDIHLTGEDIDLHVVPKRNAGRFMESASIEAQEARE